MDTAIVIAVVGLIQAVCVTIIGGLINRSNKRNEERETMREKRDACVYDLIFAVAGGTEVLLHNAHGDKINGNVDEALTSIKKAKAECNHLFNEQAAKI